MKLLPWNPSKIRALGLGVLMALALGMGTQAQAGRVANPLFGYAHMLPSPFSLPAGTLVYGTELNYGVTDFFQVGTSLIQNFNEVYNVNGKLSFADHPKFAFALTGNYLIYNYRDASDTNPGVQVTSFQPGMVWALELMPRTAFFVGGNLNYANENLTTEGIVRSGYIRGAQVETDFSWAYNPAKEGRPVGNVVSSGLSYDFTYHLVGVGVSHHWPGFHLGVHYFLNAEKSPFRPILAGGGTIEF